MPLRRLPHPPGGTRPMIEIVIVLMILLAIPKTLRAWAEWWKA